MKVGEFLKDQEVKAKLLADQALELALEGHYELASGTFSEAVEVARMIRNVKTRVPTEECS